MRKRHNLISQKGRQKINDQIMFLKTLLPECRDVECNKASILSCAARTLDKYVQMHNQIMQVNGVLERENKKLLKIIERLEGENTKYRAQLGSKGEPAAKRQKIDNLNFILCESSVPADQQPLPTQVKVENSNELPHILNLGCPPPMNQADGNGQAFQQYEHPNGMLNVSGLPKDMSLWNPNIFANLPGGLTMMDTMNPNLSFI
jgi:hypothetical protein